MSGKDSVVSNGVSINKSNKRLRTAENSEEHINEIPKSIESLSKTLQVHSTTDASNVAHEKFDENFFTLNSTLCKNGYSAEYLPTLHAELVDLMQESIRQRANRNIGDFDINAIQRVLYTPEQKLKILEVHREFHKTGQASALGPAMMNFIRSIPGYEKVSSSVIYRWRSSPTETLPRENRSGRPICVAYDMEVIDELVRCIAREIIIGASDGILAALNSVESFIAGSISQRESHTLRVFREAATTVHDRFYKEEDGSAVQKWKINLLTHKLTFSNKWMLSVLHRNELASWDLERSLSVTNTSIYVKDVDTTLASTNNKSASNNRSATEEAMLTAAAVLLPQVAGRVWTTTVSGRYNSVSNTAASLAQIKPSKKQKTDVSSAVSATTTATATATTSGTAASTTTNTVAQESKAQSELANRRAKATSATGIPTPITPVVLNNTQLETLRRVWENVVCYVKDTKAAFFCTKNTSTGKPNYKSPFAVGTTTGNSVSGGASSDGSGFRNGSFNGQERSSSNSHGGGSAVTRRNVAGTSASLGDAFVAATSDIGALLCMSDSGDDDEDEAGNMLLMKSAVV